VTEPNFRLVGRGVYRAPCLGPQDEVILYAVDHNHRWLGYDRGILCVKPGDDVHAANDLLWKTLNEVDPLVARA
jgi:hypothetical protein